MPKATPTPLTPDRVEFDNVVLDLADYFKERFNLQTYSITVCFKETEHPSTNPNRAIMANVTTDSVYFRIHVNVYPALYREWQNEDYDSVGEILTHEFCHAFTEPLDRYFRDFVSPATESTVEDIYEQATQRITRAIFPSVPTHLYHPKPKQPKNKRTPKH